jgi:RNA polymerase sigma-70 factor (ECF subfamily)
MGKVSSLSLPAQRPRAPDAREAVPPVDIGDLYRVHEQTVLRWATRLGGPGVDPEDVVQDVFVIANRRLTSFEGPGQITTWLFRTTQKVVQSARRKQRLRRWLSVSVEAGASSMGAGAPNPGDSLQRDRDIAEVYRVLDRLSERERRMVILFELEGLSTQEISALTGTKVGTVRVWLFRARARFLVEHRRLFPAHGPEGEVNR